VAAIELEIADLIERQPDEVAQTLRSWLVDRRT
jgi:flagellar biosynthesis/type III secretory pathway M-ring protein FliF/YscJ